MAPIEQELNGDAILEDRVVGAHYPKPANYVLHAQIPADSELPRNVNSPPGDDRLAHSDGMVDSANANANTSNTGDGDDMTQSGANDGPDGSSDGTDPETEALEREMGRYVPRTKPSKPAIGSQSSKQPSQSKVTNNVSQPSGTKKSRPAAVTATTKTTAPPPKAAAPPPKK